MDEIDKFPCVVTLEDLGYVISFELGQVPRSVLNDFVGRDSIKRDRAKKWITQHLLDRLKHFHIRKGPPMEPHNGSASGPGYSSPLAPSPSFKSR